MPATIPSARRVARELLAPVNVLLLAKAHAQLERQRVDVIERQVLTGLGYEKYEPRHAYQLPDSVSQRYHEQLNAIHLEAGFADAAKGFCPALVAEAFELSNRIEPSKLLRIGHVA